MNDMPKEDPQLGDLDYEMKKHENWKLTNKIKNMYQKKIPTMKNQIRMMQGDKDVPSDSQIPA